MAYNQGFLSYDSASITQRVDIYAVPNALKNADPWLVLDKLPGITRTPLPANKSDTLVWKRMRELDVDTNTLVEGVTPAAENFQQETVTDTVDQYGKVIRVTDKMYNFHSDVGFKEIGGEMGKAMATQKELINWQTIRGGSQVIYTGTATTRGTVEDVIQLEHVRKATNVLRNNHGKLLTTMLRAGTGQATEPVQASYVAVTHSDMDADLRDLDKFIESQRYGSGSLLNEYEIGACEGIRFCLTPHLEPFWGEGSTTTTGVRSRDGAAVDVYPIVVMAQDFWGTTEFKTRNSFKLDVTPPGSVKSETDPLGQRGFASYVFWYCATRLNERWGVRIESAASE